MRIAIATAIFLATSVISVGQNLSTDNSIRLTFAIDGKPVSCNNRTVELLIGERRFVPTETSTGFIVPRVFDDLYASETSRRQNNVFVIVTCDEYRLEFLGLYIRLGSDQAIGRLELLIHRTGLNGLDGISNWRREHG